MLGEVALYSFVIVILFRNVPDLLSHPCNG